MVHVVGHRERNLGLAWLVAERHVAGHAGELAVGEGQQRRAARGRFRQIRRASISPESLLMLKNRR